MEFKGTKGEWKEDIGIDLLNYDLHQIIVYSKHVNTHNVAHVFAFNQQEAEANAKLIACAPEMLKELIHLEDYISRILTLSGCDKNDIDYVLRNTKPLIKKATTI